MTMTRRDSGARLRRDRVLRVPGGLRSTRSASWPTSACRRASTTARPARPGWRCSSTLGAARPVRGPAQRHGPAVVQAVVDPVVPDGDRAQHVRARSPASSSALLLWQWRPLPDTVWSVEAGWLRGLLWTVYAAGLGRPGAQHVPHRTLRPVRPAPGPRAGPARPPTPSPGSGSRCSTGSSGTRSWSASSSRSGRRRT